MLTDEINCPDVPIAQEKGVQIDNSDQRFKLHDKVASSWLDSKNQAPVSRVSLGDCVRIASIDNFQVGCPIEHVQTYYSEHLQQLHQYSLPM